MRQVPPAHAKERRTPRRVQGLNIDRLSIKYIQEDESIDCNIVKALYLLAGSVLKALCLLTGSVLKALYVTVSPIVPKLIEVLHKSRAELLLPMPKNAESYAGLLITNHAQVKCGALYALATLTT